MNEINCENVLMAKMAELDGEKTEITPEQINWHLTECETCRQGSAQLQAADNLLKGQSRREQKSDLWRVIEKRIETRKDSPIGWQPFVLMGILLVAYKLLEMLPEENFGLLFKLAPLALITALFAFLKENPFKINTELAHGEIKL